MLVAGATVYLGRHLVADLLDRGWRVRVFVRRPQQATTFAPEVDVFVGQVTDPPTLAGVIEGIDTVFSTIGITRQRDRLRYVDADYGGNLALLRAAEAANVTRFVYISVLHGQDLRATVRLVAAKERFVDALSASPVSSVVVRPTGYFSDMEQFMTMARRGTVYVIGDGRRIMNPNSGRDLATVCVDASLSPATDVEVGGPDFFSHEEIARAALTAARTAPRIRHIPRALAVTLVRVLTRSTPEHVYGPIQFLVAVLTTDMTAPAAGSDHLADHFSETTRGVT
ncbi:NAD(P)H-binding protein [Micropruina sonneratiae]|uniref:NAD(P)H-binding protein n=1 Tax=Micropruina sonneratiae TaxID=2986940 RepID=UPI002227D8F6|nr:NAD(P)H-binding protein [Micropruina sp. KQZ13P-5]MCW3159581.1 NAD(P)H-binding protein [Micropruina sp. KQZ13P-5]